MSQSSDHINDYSGLLHKYQLLEKQYQELLLETEDLKRKLEEESAHNQLRETKGTRFKMVTVLFADVKGFSQLSGQEDAQVLIDELDSFFILLDEIVKKHQLEKISSIGDTYMVAGGIPKKNRTNPIEVILAAMEINQLMIRMQLESITKNRKTWNITLGIHTGPVVANISGKKKITYDIKGDTVNIASRIEASCEPGKIFISAMTHELVQDYFRCEYKGKVPVKYLGDIGMFHIKGFRPEYSVDGEGVVSNVKFRTRFQLIRFDDVEEFIFDKLEKELPRHLYYHNLKHTIDVCIQAEILGRGEQISDEELLLLKTAALFHDCGQIIQSKDHEHLSAEMAKEILPKYYYSLEQIKEICEIILATKLPPAPKNKLQEIICDADLDYLGRSDFVPVSNTLYRELNEQGIIGSINDWNKLQLKFITAHQYFTKTANSLREVNKQKQIDRIRSLITED